MSSIPARQSVFMMRAGWRAACTTKVCRSFPIGKSIRRIFKTCPSGLLAVRVRVFEIQLIPTDNGCLKE